MKNGRVCLQQASNTWLWPGNKGQKLIFYLSMGSNTTPSLRCNGHSIVQVGKHRWRLLDQPLVQIRVGWRSDQIAHSFIQSWMSPRMANAQPVIFPPANRKHKLHNPNVISLWPEEIGNRIKAAVTLLLEHSLLCSSLYHYTLLSMILKMVYFSL